MVFLANGSFFDQKEQIVFFTLFVKSGNRESLSSLFWLRAQRERCNLIALLKRADRYHHLLKRVIRSLLFFLSKAKKVK